MTVPCDACQAGDCLDCAALLRFGRGQAGLDTPGYGCAHDCWAGERMVRPEGRFASYAGEPMRIKGEHRVA